MTTASAVRERPIPFTGEMVLATLDGRKTKTRRVLRLPSYVGHRAELTRIQPGFADGTTRPVFDDGDDPNAFSVRCPYGQPGDRLWVREAHVLVADGVLGITPGIVYDADEEVRWNVPMRDGSMVFNYDRPDRWKRRPARFLRREHSRISLEITDVCVERVQDISEEDARAEGVLPIPHDAGGYRWDAGTIDQPYRREFATLWDSLNAARGYGWDANPWVWVVSFTKVS